MSQHTRSARPSLIGLAVVGTLLLAPRGGWGNEPPTLEPASPPDRSSGEQPATGAPAIALAPGQGPDLSWWSVDGGGGTCAGGTFVLVGAAGEPEQGVASGPGIAFAGGLWTTAPNVMTDPEIFSDGFESGHTGGWSAAAP